MLFKGEGGTQACKNTRDTKSSMFEFCLSLPSGALVCRLSCHIYVLKGEKLQSNHYMTN